MILFGKNVIFGFWFCLDIFLDNDRTHPSRSVRFSNNKASVGPENKKLGNNFSVLKLKNFHVKLRNF